MIDDEAQAVYQAYPVLIEHLLTILRPLTLMPLPEMQAANERMQTVAPFFVAPIMYHAGGQKLVDQRKVIDAAAALLDVLYSLPGAPPRPGGSERLGHQVAANAARRDSAAVGSLDQPRAIGTVAE